jgi:hypothetical protein
LRRRRRERDAALEQKRAIWRSEPDVYAKERLNLNLTVQQIEILYSVLSNRRTAVKAHHSLGKTFIAAVDLLWWLDCWSSHIGYITAPTWGQALGLTFKQAKRLALVNKLDFQILNSGIIRDWTITRRPSGLSKLSTLRPAKDSRANIPRRFSLSSRRRSAFRLISSTRWKV